MTGVNITARLSPEQRQWLFGVDNLLYWPSGNVIIPCFGKTANTAIKAAILEADGGIDPFHNVHADPRLQYIDRPFMMKAWHVPVVAVIRDPYDRLVSFWRDKVAPRTPETFTAGYLPGVVPGMEFIAFVAAFFDILAGRTRLTMLQQLGDLRPASDVLTYQGQTRINRLFSWQTFTSQAGWDEFRSFTARMYDLPRSLPKLNAPRYPAPIVSAGDQQLIRETMRNFYAADYMLMEAMAK